MWAPPWLRRRLPFGLFVTLAMSAPASGQIVHGQVIDADTDLPVPAARIVIRNAADSVVSQVVTGESGEFALAGLPRGALLLEVSALGYTASAVRRIDKAGEEVFLAVELHPSPLASEGIRVTVEAQIPILRARGYYRREQIGHGRFISPEQLDRMVLVETSDMFRRLAGVSVIKDEPRVSRGPISMDRECRPAILQDGMLLRGPLSRAAFNDVVVSPELIEAVEVYSGPATAPAQWRAQAACGLIVIWTRY